MKKFKIFALFAAIMTLAACSSSEDIANNVNNDDKMNINVTRTATNDQFADGDKITVVNLTRLDAGFPNHKATFSYSSNDHSWAKVSGALLWHKTKGVTANELYATMPYNASYDRYSIPTDQSSDDKLKSADWQVDYNKVDLGQNVGFNLHHLLSKVTIDVSLDLEEDIKASVVSKYTDCTGTRNSDGTYTISSSNTTPPLTAEISANKDANAPSLSAVIAPAEYQSGDILFKLNLSGEIISLKLNQGLTLEPGKHYSFNATITHDQATINSVSVTAWNNDSDPITPLPAEKVIPYVTFSAESQQGFKMTTNSYTITDLEYSVNNGEWTPVTANAIVTFGGDNGNLRLRGKNQKGTATGESNYSTISFTDNNVKVACTGDIRTLLDYEYYKTVATDQARFCKLFHKCTALTSAPELPATSLAERCYLSMFYGCTALKKAPEILPATTLADFCYYQMFFQCTALTTAPALPAKTLTDKCYLNMFYQCTALTTAPALPATTLAVNCYQSMFNQCTALAVAPELPATILMNYCYSGMFQKCTALKEAPVIKAEQLADNCCSNMFMECTSLTKAPELKAKETKNGCYSNMFYKCTALEIAPDLPATNLATSCYTAMFRYCNKLKYVKMLTTETQYSGLEDTRLSNWLADAGGDASSRTLILYSKAVYDAIKKYSYYLADNWKIGKATVKDKDGNTLTD